MPDKPSVEAKRHIISVLDNLIAKKEWESSAVFRVLKKRIVNYRNSLKQDIEQEELAHKVNHNNRSDEYILEGYVKVYISIYQGQGDNLNLWEAAVKNLPFSFLGRPAYDNESKVKNFMDSKVNKDVEGYAEVWIKEGGILDVPDDKVTFDTLGNKLISLDKNTFDSSQIKFFTKATGAKFRFLNHHLEEI